MYVAWVGGEINQTARRFTGGEGESESGVGQGEPKERLPGAGEQHGSKSCSLRHGHQAGPASSIQEDTRQINPKSINSMNLENIFSNENILVPKVETWNGI